LSEKTGTAVSSGDINGNGYDDTIISGYISGLTYVVFGSEFPSSRVDLSSLGLAGMTITGPESSVGVWQSSSVGAGDFNGDGYECHHWILLINNYVGITFVVFGSEYPASIVDLNTLGSAGVTINGV
jgi:hypothetical protein